MRERKEIKGDWLYTTENDPLRLEIALDIRDLLIMVVKSQRQAMERLDEMEKRMGESEATR